jgi:hypothetical protein
METFAVTVFPVAKPDEWRAWVDSIASGDRADAHRQMMRRLGIKREHIRHQASPGGDVMVLVWEGVEQDRAPELLADLVQNPQSEHERYIATHVIPDRIFTAPTRRPVRCRRCRRSPRSKPETLVGSLRQALRADAGEPRWEPPGRTTLRFPGLT